MSNKLVKLTEEQKQQQEDESFLNGRPNRAEVANYVNSIFDEVYLPKIMSSLQLSTMIIQAILLKKNICTGEEIEQISKEFTDEFIKQHQTDNNQ